MIAFGILLGVVFSFFMLFLLISFAPNTSPPDNIITGQKWFIKGVGTVEITKVLYSGHFEDYGKGANIQYLMSNGKPGCCSSKSLLKNGRIINKKQIETKEPAILKPEKVLHPNVSKNYYVYNSRGESRIITTRFRDID